MFFYAQISCTFVNVDGRHHCEQPEQDGKNLFDDPTATSGNVAPQNVIGIG
jgi:hypothetical protein